MKPDNQSIPAGYEPHFRKSPVTDPWEPLYVRRDNSGLSLGLRIAREHCNGRGLLFGFLAISQGGMAVPTKLGRTLAFADAQIVADGEMIAKAAATFRIIGIPAKAV